MQPQPPPPRLPFELYPILIAVVLVIGFMTEVSVSPFAALRLLILILILAVALTVIATVGTRDRHFGAALAAAILIVLFWSGGRTVAIVITTLPVTLVFVVIIVLLAGRLWILVGRSRARPEIARSDVSRLLNLFFGLVLVMVIATAAVNGTLADMVGDLAYPRHGLEALSERASQPSDPADPDIYVILLDGHPRADVFARVLGGDPNMFSAGLHSRDIDVAMRSRSNYSMTPLTLSSMFGMRPLEEIPQVQRLFEKEARLGAATRSAIDESSAFRLLRDRGYRIVSVASGFEQVRIDGADAVIDQGSPNEFEIIFLGRSLLGPVIDLILPEAFSEAARARVRFALDQPARLAATARQTPIFAFIHVPSPHAPILFGQDGSPLIAKIDGFFDDAARGSADEKRLFRARLRAQVEWLDQAALKMIDALDAAQASSGRTAVIIVMSDHGTGVAYGEGVEKTDIDERMSNLFAARTPGRRGVFPDDVTPMNVLPLLFRAYFGQDLPLHADRSFLSPRLEPFRYTEVPNPDADGGAP